jgi:predicted lipid-binding transport protein (Tim44 family)
MNRTRSLWLSAALLCAALLAGCGSSTTPTTSSTPAAATQPSTTATSSSTATSSPQTTTSKATTPTSTAPGAASTAKGLAATVCKSNRARAALKGKIKTRIEEICSAYAKGDQAKAREVAKKACVEAVESIPGAASLKRRAMANCEAK